MKILVSSVNCTIVLIKMYNEAKKKKNVIIEVNFL